jgi:hypothetical protein
VGHVETKVKLLDDAFGPPQSVEEDIVIYEVPPGSAEVSALVYVVPNNDGRSAEMGWQTVEEWEGHPARWMTTQAMLYIYSPDRRDGVLQFRALPFDAPKRLQIEVNREPLAPLVIGDWITYTTPAISLQPGLNQISLRALEGCKRYDGDPRCGGVVRGTAGEASGCSRYVQGERCLSVLFQDVRFVSTTSDLLARRLDVDLGEQIRLVRYDLVTRPTAREIDGASLFLSLQWQALCSPQDDYIVFVHLLDSEGNLAAQYDAPPLQGLYPTSKWVVGDLFTQQIALAAPAGKYDLVVGMYTYPHIVRLPVASDRPYAQDGLVWLQSVKIK